MATIVSNVEIWKNPSRSIKVVASYRNRTATTIEVNITYTYTLNSSIGYTGYSQYVTPTVNGQALSRITLKENSPTNWYGSPITKSTGWKTINCSSSLSKITISNEFTSTDSADADVIKSGSLSIGLLQSALGEIPSFDVESEISIPITKYVSGYFDVLKVYDENKNEILSIEDIYDGAILSLTNYGLDRLYEVMAQNTHNFTFELTTYTDSTLGTQIGTSSKLVQGYISNANPVFSDFDYEDVDEQVLVLTGGVNYVKGYSDIKISKLVATGTKGATIQYWNINNNLVENTGTNEVILEDYGSNSITIYAVDSRGNSTPLTKAIDNFIEYSKLTKGTHDHERIDNVTEQVNISFEGDIYECDFGGSTNSLKVSYKYKKTTETLFITGTTEIVPTIENNKYLFDGIIKGDTDNGFDIGNSYNVEVEVSDELSSVLFSYVIQAGIPAFAIFGNKIALGDMFDETDEEHNVQLWGNVALNGENIKKRQIITAGLYGGDVSISAKTYTKIPLNKSIRIGNKLELQSDGGIKIGSGISKILVSARAILASETAGFQYMRITNGEYQNSDENNIAMMFAYEIANQRMSLTVNSSLTEVKEGDIIYIYAYTQGTGTIRGSMGSTSLTIEAVE